MAPAHCRSENPVGGLAASHRFRKYTENVAPPFYTRGGVTSLRQLLFDTRCDCIAIGYFLFLISATIAAAAPMTAPMTANIETVTPVCCSIVGSSCFPFSAPFTLPSSCFGGLSAVSCSCRVCCQSRLDC